MVDQISKLRVIIDEKKSAKQNMAIDESLVLNFEENNLPILRLYHWENSYTLGVSQKTDEYIFKEYNQNFAKRITGGGVLFHGHDISYSLVLPTTLFNGYSIKESYENICTFIINFYKNLDLNVCYAKEDERIKLSKSAYCQVGFEAYDILVNGQKIGGNAQRRTKKAIFQHGSIPLVSVQNCNTYKNEIGMSLEDVGIHLEFEEAKKLLIQSFERTFNVKTEYTNLTTKESLMVEKLLKDKYDYANK